MKGVNGDLSTLPQARKHYEMQLYKQHTTLPWLNTAERNKGQIWTTYSIMYLCIHIIQVHYFIQPVPILTLCRYFNVCVCVCVCVRIGQSPATISATPFNMVRTASTVLCHANSIPVCSAFYVSFYCTPSLSTCLTHSHHINCKCHQT